MARARIIDTKVDINTDNGAVLFSLIQGEQLEFPVAPDFLQDIDDGYIITVSLVEGENDSGEKPTAILSGGKINKLETRIPYRRGLFQDGSTYYLGELVLYNDVFYESRSIQPFVAELTPDLDSRWFLSGLNQFYIRFDKMLSRDWSVQPVVNMPTYGFMEVSISEPLTMQFRSIWKPLRGMIEFLYSPTLNHGG